MGTVSVTRAGAAVKVVNILGTSVLCLRLPLESIRPNEIWTSADGQPTRWVGFEGGWRSLGIGNLAAIKAMLPEGLEECGVVSQYPYFGLLDVTRPPHQDSASIFLGPRDGGRWFIQLTNGSGIRWRAQDKGKRTKSSFRS